MHAGGWLLWVHRLLARQRVARAGFTRLMPEIDASELMPLS